MPQVGAKVALEGEKEFNDALKNINSQLKVNYAQMALVSQKYADSSDITDKLRAESEKLGDTIKNQKEKIQLMQAQLEKLKNSLGENSTRTTQFQASLLNAQTQLEKLEQKQRSYQEALEASGDGTKSFSERMDSLNDSIDINASKIELINERYSEGSQRTEALRASMAVLSRSIESQREKISLLSQEFLKSSKETGATSDQTKEYQKSLLQAQIQLEQMEQEQRQYAKELENSGRITAFVVNGVKELASGLGINLPPQVEKAIGSISSLDGGMMALNASAVAMTTALVVVEKKLYDLTAQAAQSAGDIGTIAQEYGITAEQVQMLAVAEEKLEVANGTITQSMSKLTEKLASGSDAFEALGVEVKTSSGQYRDTLSIFMDVIDALGDVENETEANMYAQQLFGETFAHLNPLVLAGSDAITQYGEEARAAGQIMSNDTVAALDAVYQKNLDVERGWKSITNALAESFAPAAESVDDLLIDDLQPALKDLAETYGPAFADILVLLTDALDAMSPALDLVVLGLESFSIVIQTVAAAVDSLGQMIAILGSEGRKTMADFDPSMWQGVADSFSVMTNTASRNWGRNANGTDYWRGGMTWVGETGPELVSLPRGSRIYSNAESTARSVSNTYYCSIDARRVKEFNDVVKIAQAESTKIRQGVSREG